MKPASNLSFENKRRIFGSSLRACLLFVFFAFMLAACPSSVEEGPGQTIYTAGYHDNGSVSTACYWENEEKHDLGLPPGGTNGRTSGIAVSGDDVYIAGYYENSGGNSTACYWKNGTVFELELPPGGTKGRASAIAVTASGFNVYITGTYEKGGNPGACYWKNGANRDLDGTAAGAAAVSETLVESETGVKAQIDFYAAGSCEEGGVNKACYWRTSDSGTGGGAVTTRHGLAGGDGGAALALVVSGSDICTAGFYNDGPKNTACYWKNGTRTGLAGGNMGAALAVSGGDVYIAGSYQNSGGNSRACYWKNGGKVDLGGGEFYTCGIAVK